MKHKKIILSAFLVLVAAMFAVSVSAQENLPPNLQKIIDFNNQQTIDFAVKISFFIAFAAGMLGILSPCILPFLPAYFSYTFKEKKNITKMTFVFFLGFSLIFITMGVIAGFIGEQTLSIIQKGWLVAVAGIFMIGLGIATLSGKKVCLYINYKRFKNDAPGTFLFGMFFAVGWTACLGPILAGILGIGAILGNIGYSALLMFFYSLGNLVPLFILSMLYDKFNLAESRFIKGKMFKFSVFGKEIYFHSTNLISGLLFLIIGAVLLAYKGTAVFNTFDILGTKQYFYSIQRQLIGWQYSNILGIITFHVFILAIAGFLLKYKKSNMASEVTKRKYDRNSLFYDILEYIPEKLVFNKWRKRILPDLEGNILEVGAGTGKNLQYYSENTKVTGIDISQGMLNKAINESNKLKRDCSLLQMDAQNLRFRDNTFDNVVCTFLLCSVPDPVKALTEMKRVCKSDAKIIMIEHVLSKNKLIAFFQHIHNPITKFLFGFNVNRDTINNIKKAGLKIIKEENLALSDVFKFVICEPNKK